MPELYPPIPVQVDMKSAALFKKILFLFLIATTFSFRAEQATGNAWVKEKIAVSSLPDEVKKLAAPHQLSLVLLGKKHRIMKTSGRQYLKCYLVNHTGKTVSIHRADEKIGGIMAQVRENNTWVTYQVSGPVFCGNSYWTQTLEKEKCLLVYYDYAPKTSEKVSLRLVFGAFGDTIYSNAITIEK